MYLIYIFNTIYSSNLNNIKMESCNVSNDVENLSKKINPLLKFEDNHKTQSHEANIVTNNNDSIMDCEKSVFTFNDDINLQNQNSNIKKKQSIRDFKVENLHSTNIDNLDKNATKTEVIVKKSFKCKNPGIVIKIESDNTFDSYDGASNCSEQVSFSLQQWKILDRLSELAVIEEENNVSKKIKSYEEKINKLENNINCLSDNTIYTSISYEKSKSA